MAIETLELKISGMTCDHCARSIEKRLSHEGILDKSVSYGEAMARIKIEKNKISATEVEQMINESGSYRVQKTLQYPVRNGKENHLVIIGGGSAAFAAAIRANELGVRVTMINDGLPIGGTCVNVGCVPSKNLIRAAETLHKANHNPFPGIKSEGRVTDFKEIIAQKQQLVEQLRQQKYIDVVKDLEQFERLNGLAKVVSSGQVQVNEKKISASHILVATGARPEIPDIPGLKEVSFLTNETAFELEEVPESILVLGGRYIALEMAQMFSRLGSRVTVLQRSSRILPDETSDLTDALTGYLEEEGIKIVTGNRFKNIYQQDGFVYVETEIAGNTAEFSAKQIVVATGRRPNSDIGLSEIGVQIGRDGSIQVNDYLQTNIPNIYASGDVLGEKMFVYTAAYEGKLAVDNMFNDSLQKKDYHVLPWVVFTDPQIAGVGMDENQGREQGIDTETAVLPLSYVPRAIAARDDRGFIKLIRDKKTDKLIGARILAPEGGEMLMQIAMAIKFGITTKQIKDLLYPYLTLSEGIKLAAITFSKDVKELSCCAT